MRIINQLHLPVDPASLTSFPANDNAMWTRDPWLSARMFSEVYRRYRRMDPKTLSAVRQAYRDQILYWSLDAIRACWKELSAG